MTSSYSIRVAEGACMFFGGNPGTHFYPGEIVCELEVALGGFPALPWGGAAWGGGVKAGGLWGCCSHLVFPIPPLPQEI